MSLGDEVGVWPREEPGGFCRDKAKPRGQGRDEARG